MDLDAASPVRELDLLVNRHVKLIEPEDELGSLLIRTEVEFRSLLYLNDMIHCDHMIMPISMEHMQVRHLRLQEVLRTSSYDNSKT